MDAHYEMRCFALLHLFWLTTANILNNLTVFKLTATQDPEQFTFLNEGKKLLFLEYLQDFW